MPVIEMRNKVTLFMIVLFYGVKLFHVHFKINYNGCIVLYRFWPVSSDHHPYFASYSSGWIGTVSSGAPLILYKSELTH
jgi:hypothetical protein